MSCLTGLYSQTLTLLRVPHEIFFLQHKVFREYARVTVGPDFIHTLPSFLILSSVAILLWRNPPSCNSLAQAITSTILYKALQVLVSWVVAIAVLWLWLILQRLLYCSVWAFWSYESEYRDVSYQWWQRIWSSYYPPPSQPPVMSAGFISWIISMLIAIVTLGCAYYSNRVWNLLSDSMIGLKDTIVLISCYENSYLRRILAQSHWLQEESAKLKNGSSQNDSEASSTCDECRSEMSSEMNHLPQTQVHPISYGTNWMPKPSFSGFKDPQKKVSMKSLHTVAVVNDIQDSDDLSIRQLRYKRGCHTVIPSNSSDQSSGC
ncbi:uncharacterized protein LOC117609157 [Osmia lignaria lignaria]|uniref:uncharacterized protein LOC117609157 n=1 Tax=Osmia lignaria lignaria TaxID=1437193 RepID=UPI00402B725A